MTDDARQLMAQHAVTAKLFGVDFLPLGTAPESLISTQSSGIDIESEDRQSPHDDHDEIEHPIVGRDEVSGQASGAVSGSDQPNFLPRPDVNEKPVSAVSADIPKLVDSKTLQSAWMAQSNPGDQLNALRSAYEQHAPHQHFVTSFNNIVFGEGDSNADLMFVGEAPGADEDRTGKPFVGRAGQLLEKMIVAMGFTRETVYITNVLKTRPDNNATPTQQETALCAPYLFEQIRIVKPRVVVTLGLPASHLLLQTSSSMRSLRGNWHPMVMQGEAIKDEPEVSIMPTYHPAYLLRSYTEQNRRAVWSDLQQVITRLSESSS